MFLGPVGRKSNGCSIAYCGPEVCISGIRPAATSGVRWIKLRVDAAAELPCVVQGRQIRSRSMHKRVARSETTLHD